MKREPVIKLEIHGIKCDTPLCLWRDDGVKLEEYPAWVDKKCPNCGGNLLTKEDIATVNRIVKVTAFINKFLWWWPKGKPQYFKIELDGSGKAKIE